LGTTRTHPPLTRLESRLQALEEEEAELNMNNKTAKCNRKARVTMPEIGPNILVN
jgi:hypothetical protein